MGVLSLPRAHWRCLCKADRGAGRADQAAVSALGTASHHPHVDAHEPVPAPFRLIKGRWRCAGYHYGPLQPELHARGLRDTVPRWQRLDLPLQETREPHAYQVEAVAAWEQAGQRGSIVLPTGAGKTFVAIQAMSRVNRSTLVVAPTIDLLHQWYARLANAFGRDVGVYYGGEKTAIGDASAVAGRVCAPRAAHAGRAHRVR
jgi:hypothetical protein